MKKQAPYGSWSSAISADLLTQKNATPSYPQTFGDTLYWQVAEPHAKRATLYYRTLGETTAQELLPATSSVGTSVNIYGGQAWCPILGGALFFDTKDNAIKIKRINEDSTIEVYRQPTLQFADFHYCEKTHSAVCVAEETLDDHSQRQLIIFIDITSNTVTKWDVKADFIAFPRLAPNGKKLSWMAWDIDAMSWENSRVEVADLIHGERHNQHQISPPNPHAVFQPSWSPNSELFWVSDENNWWQIKRELNPSPVTQTETEYGRPFWLFGWSTYAFINNDELYALNNIQGQWQLEVINLNTNTTRVIALPFTLIEDVVCWGGQAVFLASNPTQPMALYSWSDELGLNELSPPQKQLEKAHLSIGQSVIFPTPNGDCQGYFYPPKNPDFKGTENTLPPLIVLAHGGPTAMTDNSLKLKVQYWTSRGYAIFDINYTGSTGFGRDFRLSLNKQWGIKDVEDVCAAADYAADMGWCDPNKKCIKGGSAGGFTVLSALTFKSTFNTGASHYGVADLIALDDTTHRFEASYNQSLVGTRPTHNDRYQSRSPLNSADQLTCPVIFFHGMKDKVVWPEQAFTMTDAMQKNGIPYTIETFEDEGHGFKAPETIARVLACEHYFYGKILGFDIAEQDLPSPVPDIINS